MGRCCIVMLLVFVSSFWEAHAQGTKDVVYSYPDKQLKVIYSEFDDYGAYSVQVSPDVEPPSNTNLKSFPFDKNKKELVRVAKETFTMLLMKYYPQICIMLAKDQLQKAVFYLNFYDRKELFHKTFTFFAVADNLKRLSYLNAFERLTTSDNSLKSLVKEAEDKIYSSVSPSILREELPADIRNKIENGDEGYDYCDFIFIEIYPKDVLNRAYDSLEFVKTEHGDMNKLSVTEKNTPIGNSKLQTLPFDDKDEKFQQVCKEVFVQSLKEICPAVCVYLVTDKLSEIRLTLNLDDKGELYEQGFNFHATTKFAAITDVLTKKFMWSTLLRQIVNRTSKLIYERFPVQSHREVLAKEFLQKVEAGEKGYGYYTQMEIWITKDDFKK